MLNFGAPPIKGIGLICLWLPYVQSASSDSGSTKPDWWRGPMTMLRTVGKSLISFQLEGYASTLGIHATRPDKRVIEASWAGINSTDKLLQ
jgi:hypothetical protein